jgi:hypothetical protein
MARTCTTSGRRSHRWSSQFRRRFVYCIRDSPFTNYAKRGVVYLNDSTAHG